MNIHCGNCCNNCRGGLCASKVPIFENLNRDELVEIVNKINHKEFNKGDVIFTEGNIANTLYFINEGKIKLYKYTKDGKEQILHILSEGDFFGELELIKPSKYGFNSKAIEDAKICTLTKEEMKDIMMKNPEIGIKVLETVGERLSKVENLVQNLATNDVDSRMAYLIIELMEKYGENVEGNISVKLPISREDMASYIGVTRETISRKLKKLEDENLIKIIGTKTIIIIDEEGLKNYI
ncbi:MULTISPECIES: Crp/Fnr family transcriptional regulator [Clostridium]|mgnify:CR=1 FL=1|jgi:transcriptional regulator, Crp/Fnr family|uniref:Crp/Fnr family transcriptional regulator n=2 Tax=Clostridium beijerinckii TaxID=1520 RepID=A0A1S8RCE7_CLOBE|nr:MULTISPECIES: Crp/Fnr family transcriptional regulator [Clostridium]ABR35155.1 putative transcriptional regulator, Crp/Fnr family [Clostridium beijerinckii NCIMB 8052]AIU02113.1 CRP/FNR family transcriptional regulator [Clostridium beijerinckii ATCC 35702]MBF7810211.1 Crp/Fnr family transcriptional regulator [Clostridium beijerinckii]NOW90853.1 CRP/FNR family transcriptional regulator [Clostridium beijerinckii]NRT23454.1 CRP/FNR family transcriptional regulator [Clostridium beijerinckii]